jgi:hypothetical protein
MRWCEVYLVPSLPVAPSASFFSFFFLRADFDMSTVEDGKATAVPETERDPNFGEGTELEQEKTDRIITGDKVELQDSDAWDKLGYSFPTWRKW